MTIPLRHICWYTWNIISYNVEPKSILQCVHVSSSTSHPRRRWALLRLSATGQARSGWELEKLTHKAWPRWSREASEQLDMHIKVANGGMVAVKPHFAKRNSSPTLGLASLSRPDRQC
eukprot:514243-Amphidinium_carterae.2